MNDKGALVRYKVVEGSESEGVLKLTNTVRYLVGIAEVGEGRPMLDDETAEQFVLRYVQRLEQELHRARSHALRREPAEPVRDEVARFAVLMERKLKANDHKDHWSDCGMSYLLKRLREELVELEGLLLATSTPGQDEVAGEAADVANFAMMIADNFGALPTGPRKQP